jgi:drug/metabolite transporter (DMT)-like permease
MDSRDSHCGPLAAQDANSISFHFLQCASHARAVGFGRLTRAGTTMVTLEGHAVGYAWAFLASLANATQDNLRKYASGRVKHPIEIVALSELVNVVALTTAILVTGKWGAMVRAVKQAELVALAAAAGWLKALSAALLQRALQLSPLSLCVPYLAFTPLWLLVFSFFLVKEVPTVRGSVGVVVITLGAYLLNSNADDGKSDKSPRIEEGMGSGLAPAGSAKRSSAMNLESLIPVTATLGWMSLEDNSVKAPKEFGRFSCVSRSLSKQLRTLRQNPGSVITLFVAAVYALVADLDKLGKLHADDLLVFICLQRYFLCAPALTFVFLKSKSSLKSLSSSKTIVSLALIGLLDIASMAAFLQALNYIFTSYAVAAKRTSILASVVGGALFFKEPIAKRLPFIFVMFFGMALILLADADRH